MKESCHPPCPPCTPNTGPLYNGFQIENMTIIHPPLLKIYFWEYFGINSLNASLREQLEFIEHNIDIPPRQCNSCPLKIILWIRNTSDKPLDLHLRRIQNCGCQPTQTRVGFNQFRQLYNCPHRRLIYIMQERMHLNPNDLVAMSIVFYYFLLGKHKLTFEMSTSDSRIILFHFNMNIACYDPSDFILTKQLLPIDIKEHRRFVQPIWVSNITTQHLNYGFSSRDHGLKLLNPNLTVPRLSVWPLMVLYRPNDKENTVELQLNVEGNRTQVTVFSEGVVGNASTDTIMPIEDYPCADIPYVVYPNTVDFVLEVDEERSQMVAIHNYSQKCVEFRWQNYVISDLFEVTFTPGDFRLKAHRSKLVVISVRVFNRPLYFTRIPLALEVHRIFNKSTRIAKELLEEVESIDDPKWKESSYMMHIFLQLNLKVNFKREEQISIKWEPQDADNSSGSDRQQITVFEKFYWDYLACSDFMRPDKKHAISEELAYGEVLQLHRNPSKSITDGGLTRPDVLRMISQLLAESMNDFARNWVFVKVEDSEDDNKFRKNR